jgi:hypothetical protein
LIDLLKKELELKLGQKIENRGDAELLANAIQETIDQQISYNTIRRFFGVSTNVKPNNNTLNILARFIGFKNYIHFTQTYSFREKKNIAEIIYKAIYNQDNEEIISLIKRIKKTPEDFVSFIILLVRELIYNKKYHILNNIFKLKEMEFNSFSYSEVLLIGNSTGLLLRKNQMDNYILLKNRNFLQCVYSSFVDYSNINGFYGEWAKFVVRNKVNKEIIIFSDAILQLRKFLNQKKIQNDYEELAYSNKLHPILCSRLLSLSFLNSPGQKTDETLIKYIKSHSKKKQIYVDYFYELFITAIYSKNIHLMKSLINIMNVSRISTFTYQKDHLNMYYFMCLFYYQSIKNKVEIKKYLKLININFFKSCYEDFINLLFQVFWYHQAKNKTTKESHRNKYLELAEKLNYPYFDEKFLLEYISTKK